MSSHEPALRSGEGPDLSRLERLRQAAKFTQVGEELPGLIEDLLILQREGSDVDRDEVASLMVRACHIARVMANLTGHHDLAWNALERELANADALGAPLERAAATWDLCGACLHAGALEEARNAALTGLDQLEGHVDIGDAELKALWGALHLRAAVAYGRLWSTNDARRHVDEARRVAGPHVLNRPMARELVADLLGRARRGINPDLRRIAGLMGAD